MTSQENSVWAHLEAFQEKNALFKTEEGQKILWPIKNLPENMRIGDRVRLNLATSGSLEEEREAVAKEVLNQLLNP